jgi:hypothetical protein
MSSAPGEVTAIELVRGYLARIGVELGHEGEPSRGVDRVVQRPGHASGAHTTCICAHARE